MQRNNGLIAILGERSAYRSWRCKLTMRAMLRINLM